ncbi:MAG TPA: hypothetical protein VGJ43_01300 [Acidimicrobiales bacterium]
MAVHHTRAWSLIDRRTRALVPVTGPARTLVDLCAVVDDLEALTALDEIRRRRLATWEELWEALVRHSRRGRRGIARYRRTLEARQGRSVPDTMFARLFLVMLGEHGLPEPASEHPVTAGGRRYRLDLAYAGARVAVELDGRGRHTEASFESDRARDSRLAPPGGWSTGSPGAASSPNRARSRARSRPPSPTAHELARETSGQRSIRAPVRVDST